MIRKIKAKTTTYIHDSDIFALGAKEIEFVKQAAVKDHFGRARLCLHKNQDDKVQEMVIAMMPDTYVRPHRHKGKAESYHLIEGGMTVVLFDEKGNLSRRVTLKADSKESLFAYRVSAGVWHTVVVDTKPVVFHEISAGPYTASGLEFASWSPAETDKEAVKKFIRSLVI
jgi:glucose-6-phosphate isomerase